MQESTDESTVTMPQPLVGPYNYASRMGMPWGNPRSFCNADIIEILEQNPDGLNMVSLREKFDGKYADKTIRLHLHQLHEMGIVEFYCNKHMTKKTYRIVKGWRSNLGAQKK